MGHLTATGAELLDAVSTFRELSWPGGCRIPPHGGRAWEGPGSHALLEASQLLSFPGFHPLSLNLESSSPTYLSGRTTLWLLTVAL